MLISPSQSTHLWVGDVLIMRSTRDWLTTPRWVLPFFLLALLGARGHESRPEDQQQRKRQQPKQRDEHACYVVAPTVQGASAGGTQREGQDGCRGWLGHQAEHCVFSSLALAQSKQLRLVRRGRDIAAQEPVRLDLARSRTASEVGTDCGLGQQRRGRKHAAHVHRSGRRKGGTQARRCQGTEADAAKALLPARDHQVVVQELGGAVSRADARSAELLLRVPFYHIHAWWLRG